MNAGHALAAVGRYFNSWIYDGFSTSPTVFALHQVGGYSISYSVRAHCQWGTSSWGSSICSRGHRYVLQVHLAVSACVCIYEGECDRPSDFFLFLHRRGSSVLMDNKDLAFPISSCVCVCTKEASPVLMDNTTGPVTSYSMCRSPSSILVSCTKKYVSMGRVWALVYPNEVHVFFGA